MNVWTLLLFSILSLFATTGFSQYPIVFNEPIADDSVRIKVHLIDSICNSYRQTNLQVAERSYVHTYDTTDLNSRKENLKCEIKSSKDKAFIVIRIGLSGRRNSLRHGGSASFYFYKDSLIKIVARCTYNYDDQCGPRGWSSRAYLDQDIQIHRDRKSYGLEFCSCSFDGRLTSDKLGYQLLSSYRHLVGRHE